MCVLGGAPAWVGVPLGRHKEKHSTIANISTTTAMQAFGQVLYIDLERYYHSYVLLLYFGPYFRHAGRFFGAQRS